MPSFFKNITIDDVGYVKLPVGDTSQRPSNTQNGQMRFNSDRGIPEFRDNAQAEWKRQNQPSQVVATGGDVVYDIEQFGKHYRVHVFTQDGTFSISKGGEVEYLVVAGGGAGGGGAVGGGGGAGGMLEGTASVVEQAYSVTVGEGGIGGDPNNRSTSGTDSSISGIESTTGGGRGSGNDQNGLYDVEDGGSGGGRRFSSRIGSGIPGQGNDGGDWADGGNQRAGGGGGAGGPGADGGDTRNGGIGRQSLITGTANYYAGGGAGGIQTESSSNPRGDGGLGGGGDGASNDNPSAFEPGVDGTGGGGGGADGGGTSGSGGSGIVVARYEIRDQEQLTAADQDITEGLVLDLDFAKPTVYTGSGSTVSDSRLFPVEGSVNGASYVNARTHRAAFEFDGSDDYIDLGDFYPRVISNAPFSFSIWAKTFYSGSAEKNVFTIELDGTWSLKIGIENGNFLFTSYTSNSRVEITGPQIVTNQWVNLTAVRDGNDALFYFNGALEGSDSAPGNLNSNVGEVYIGNGDAPGTSSQEPWEGPIASVKGYNKALSAQEVQNLYNLTRWRFGV